REREHVRHQEGSAEQPFPPHGGLRAWGFRDLQRRSPSDDQTAEPTLVDCARAVRAIRETALGGAKAAIVLEHRLADGSAALGLAAHAQIASHSVSPLPCFNTDQLSIRDGYPYVAQVTPPNDEQAHQLRWMA